LKFIGRVNVKLAWLTDIHLDHCTIDEIKLLGARLDNLLLAGIIISGDISTSTRLCHDLNLLANIVRTPIYFVLGNHDCYGSSISKTREAVVEIPQESWLFYLPFKGLVPLSTRVCLIGYDSWADGRYGDYKNSSVTLNDYYQIKELQYLTKEERLRKLNALGDESAALFRTALLEAFKEYDHVFAVMHVPPFAEAAWHQGHASSDYYLPHFSCKAVGDTLKEVMKAFPAKNLTVLCGHTHSAGTYYALPNLVVRTGHATYGNPEIQDIIHITLS